jgi:hypothetical protein
MRAHELYSLMRSHEASVNDLDEPRYSIAAIARATDVPPATLRSWLQRRHLWLAKHDSPAEAFGHAHRLSLRSALRIGAMAELIALGVPPRRAGEAALRWTEAGTLERLPAGLYAKPMTVLCVNAGGGAEVKNVPLNGPADTLFHGGNGVTAVFLELVDRAVRTRLGADQAAA